MTRSPQETLRAVVEGRPEYVTAAGITLDVYPTPREIILARTLLAVMKRCEESRGNTDGFGAMAEELIQVIHDGLKEME